MLPEITYKQIRNVEFPIFVIPKGELYFKDGLLFVNNKVLDDKNMPGETLGIRRLQTPHKLKRLTTSVYDLESLIASAKLNFIDNRGRIFRYKKTRFLEVKYHKIKSVQLLETYTVLSVHGIPSKYILRRPPQDGEEWAGILYISDRYPWALYNLSPRYLPSSKKKV